MYVCIYVWLISWVIITHGLLMMVIQMDEMIGGLDFGIGMDWGCCWCWSGGHRRMKSVGGWLVGW